jgi:hypothetical protein
MCWQHKLEWSSTLAWQSAVSSYCLVCEAHTKTLLGAFVMWPCRRHIFQMQQTQPCSHLVWLLARRLVLVSSWLCTTQHLVVPLPVYVHPFHLGTPQQQLPATPQRRQHVLGFSCQGFLRCRVYCLSGCGARTRRCGSWTMSQGLQSLVGTPRGSTWWFCGRVLPP